MKKKTVKSVSEFKKLYKSNQIKPKATPVAARKFQELEMKIDRVLIKMGALENEFHGGLQGVIDTIAMLLIRIGEIKAIENKIDRVLLNLSAIENKLTDLINGMLVKESAVTVSDNVSIGDPASP